MAESGSRDPVLTADWSAVPRHLHELPGPGSPRHLHRVQPRHQRRVRPHHGPHPPGAVSGYILYLDIYLVSTLYLHYISTYLPHQVQAPGPDPGLACGPGTGWNTSLDAGNLQRTGAAVLVPAHCSPHTSLPVCRVAAGLLLVSPPDGLPGYCPAPASSGAIVHVSIVHSDYTRPHQTRVLSTDTESTVQAA